MRLYWLAFSIWPTYLLCSCLPLLEILVIPDSSCMLMQSFRIQERIQSIKRKGSIKFLLILSQGKLPQVTRNPLKKLIPFSAAEQVAPALLTSFSKVSTLRRVMWKSNVHKSPLILPGSADRRWRKTGACIYLFFIFYFLDSCWEVNGQFCPNFFSEGLFFSRRADGHSSIFFLFFLSLSHCTVVCWDNENQSLLKNKLNYKTAIISLSYTYHPPYCNGHFCKYFRH